MSQSTFPWDRKKVWIYLAIIAIIYAILYIITFAVGDFELTLMINQWQTAFPSWYLELAEFYTKYGYFIFGFTGIGVALLSFFSPKFEKLKPYRIMFLGLIYGFVFAWATTEGLKLIITRNRPFVDHPEINSQHVGEEYKVPPQNHESFPSGHATAAFGMSAASMVRVKNWGLRILFYAFAITVALSRPFLGFHYVTDILTGSLIGLAGSLGLYFLFEYLNAKGKLAEKTLKVLLIVGLLLVLMIIIYDFIK